MTTIYFNKAKHVYDQAQATFKMNELDTPGFDTAYEIVNPQTKKSVRFELSHSTGSEWDPNTIWIYWTVDCKYKLEISQSAILTKSRADAYLAHKS